MKLVAGLVGCMLAAPALFLGFYDVHNFRPYLPAIRTIYADMDEGDRNPPNNVQDFVLKVDGRIVGSLDARDLLSELGPRMNMGSWHYHSTMWRFLLPLHFTQKERVAFYCHYLKYESGSGLNEASGFYFHKPSDQLTTDELAAIVAIGRAPMRNSPFRHPERLQYAKQRVLSQYAAAQ